MKDLTDEIFQACTSYSLDELKLMTSTVKYLKLKAKYKIEDIRKTLKDHGMEEYAVPLYHFMILVCKKIEKFPSRLEKELTVTKEDVDFKVELVRSLKELLEGANLESTIINLIKTITIKHKKLNDIMRSSAIKSLTKAIRKVGLNSYPLTNDEAIAAINSHTDVEWVKNWMESMGYIDPNYSSFTLDRFDDYFSKLDLSPVLPELKEKLRTELIDEYACDHPQEADINIEELNRILHRIRKLKSKRGPKEYKISEKYVAHTLSILIRVERYLQRTDIESIQNINITNDDCRFIHDVLAFFGLMIDYRTPKNEKNLPNTIRKMLITFTDHATIDDTDQKLRILKFRHAAQQ